MTPTQCTHPACNRWTYADYCSDECKGFVTANAAKGIGMVIPPHKVRYSQPKRVRRNEGYIIAGKGKFGGVWVAREPAPYFEFARDCQMPARKTNTTRDTGPNAQSTAHKASLISRMAPSNGGNPDA